MHTHHKKLTVQLPTSSETLKTSKCRFVSSPVKTVAELLQQNEIGFSGFPDAKRYSLRVLDRCSSVVKGANGRFLNLTRIEERLTHPAVAVVVLIAGRSLIAVVEKREEVSEQQLLETWKDRVATYQLPKRVVFSTFSVENGTLNGNGKPMRRLLMDRYGDLE